MKTVLLIGLGRFGRHAALKLNELGHQVMAIDKDEERVNDVMPYVQTLRSVTAQARNFWNPSASVILMYVLSQSVIISKVLSRLRLF